MPLSQGKEEFSLKMILPEDNETILASEFKLYMPSKEQLIAEVKQIREDFEKNMLKGPRFLRNYL